MVDKKDIRKTFDEAETQVFATLDATDKSLFFLTQHYQLTWQKCVLDMSDASFTEFCKLKYTRRNIRNGNKARRELFQINDVPNQGDILKGCKVISVQKQLNLVYISYDRLERARR